VPVLAFAALALASGSLAQVEEGESSSAPLELEAIEAREEGPVNRAESSKTPEELAGDVEPSEGSEGEDWDDFENWGEETGESAGGGGKAFAFQLGGFVEGLTGVRVVPSSASANEFTAGEARFTLAFAETYLSTQSREKSGSTSAMHRFSFAAEAGST